MVIGVRIVIERALRRLRFRPAPQRRKVLVGRQVISAAGDHQLLNRQRLREMHEQALGSFLVLGELPDGPEERNERREATFWACWEAVSPALSGNSPRSEEHT